MPMFRLTRYLSIASFLSITLAITLLVVFYRWAAIDSLIDVEESKNVTLAQVTINAMQPDFDRFLQIAPSTDVRISYPVTEKFEERIRSQFKGLSIIEINVYDIDGRPIFSSGNSAGENSRLSRTGFIAARTGQVKSELVYRDVSGEPGKLHGSRDHLATYMPIRRSIEGQVEGVFEIYSDMTNQLGALQKRIIFGVAAILVLLYLAFFFIVKRAYGIIKYQEVERLRRNALIEHRATHDVLTGLPNRALFMDHIEHALNNASRNESLVGILFMDLDKFKPINDRLGHDQGDQLLQQTSDRIRGCVREVDSVAKLGGDEFIVVLGDVKHVDEVTVIALRILDSIKDPFELENAQATITASIGITVYPFDEHDMNRLVKNADTAMYRAKDKGGNTYQFYTAEMNIRTSDYIDRVSHLRHALARDEYELHYQPRVDFSNGRICGMEALIRWNYTNSGLNYPDNFVPLLEDTGLIIPVGEWALRTACYQHKKWLDAGIKPMSMSVNISPRQFKQQNLTKIISNILNESGLDPQCLELELTENLLMEDPEASAAMLNELKDMGIRIAIDDFGIGYSSLSYLKLFPVDTIKIDKSFIKTMLTSKADSAIVSAIIELGHKMKLRMIAEGVENERQYAYLRSLGCHEFQGFLYNRALEADAFEILVTENKPLILQDPSLTPAAGYGH